MCCILPRLQASDTRDLNCQFVARFSRRQAPAALQSAILNPTSAFSVTPDRLYTAMGAGEDTSGGLEGSTVCEQADRQPGIVGASRRRTSAFALLVRPSSSTIVVADHSTCQHHQRQSVGGTFLLREPTAERSHQPINSHGYRRPAYHGISRSRRTFTASLHITASADQCVRVPPPCSLLRGFSGLTPTPRSLARPASTTLLMIFSSFCFFCCSFLSRQSPSASCLFLVVVDLSCRRRRWYPASRQHKAG